MAVDEKILHKVRALLNLAGNNPSQEEAQTALLKAQKLMIEHGIEQRQIDDAPPIQKDVVHGDVPQRGAIAWWKKSLGTVIADNFRCFLYYYAGSKLVFLGLKNDVEFAKVAYGYAEEALVFNTEDFIARYRIKNWRIRLDKETLKGVRNDFITGWLKGLSDQYQEQIKQNNWSLVLVKDALVTQSYDNMKLKKGKGSSILTDRNKEAYNSGYEKGKSFSGRSTAIKGANTSGQLKA